MWKPLIFLALFLFLLPVYLSEEMVERLPIGTSAREFYRDRDLRYGLDLAGGRQLDFVVDLSQVDEQIAKGSDITRDEVVEGVMSTLRRRIDPDSSREIGIYSANYGDEIHVFVELSADLDNEETLALLQKYIDLDFRELVQNTDPKAQEVYGDIMDNIRRSLSVSRDRTTTLEDLNGTISPYGAVIDVSEQEEESGEMPEGELVTEPEVRADGATAQALGDDGTIYEIQMALSEAVWVKTGLGGQNFLRANVSNATQTGESVVVVEFDSEGSTLFTELTERLVGRPMGIFVGGEMVSAPVIQQVISTGSAQISFGGGDLLEIRRDAIDLANDLNAGAIDAPVLLVGERRISPEVGERALELSLWAGMVGYLLVCAYMLVMYRLFGIMASVALGVYLYLLFGIVQLLPIFIFPPLVLTLSGVAGMILSLGFAVDANVLIFERIREELKAGKTYATAISLGFERAWSGIRDANGTTLLICLILYFLGTQEIAKFSLMLALGICLSLFTAVAVTQYLLHLLGGREMTRGNPERLMGE